MRKLIIASILLLAPAFASASGGAAVPLEDAGIDLDDKASLQRGAKYYVNYCMGCHSLKYMRYNRMAEDLGIDDVDLRQSLIFTGAKPGELMANALRPEDGEKWFGTAVPDLTLVTRWRSPDWVYSYLKGFYLDDSRPYGVNNLVFPDVGMPHVLGPLQGVQEAVYTESHGEEGEAKKHLEGIELVETGSMSPDKYDGMARDLTNFLTYAGEPIKREREKLGIYVLLFLGLFFIVAYALKKEYWKDVH
ncbi:MAG: cytochrome c1 [Pseudomonadota bacterium]|nr:cytochrome c1 [Pseudomonadota bacterium]